MIPSLARADRAVAEMREAVQCLPPAERLVWLAEVQVLAQERADYETARAALTVRGELEKQNNE